MAARIPARCRAGALLALIFSAAVARGEGAGSPPRGGSSAGRLHASAAVTPFGRGLVSIGGAALRYLAPGAKRWTTLHEQPGDNLYRVARDEERGRLLAFWEKDPFIHCFTVATGQHTRIPKPAGPTSLQSLFVFDSLAFSPEGDAALIYGYGSRGPAIIAWRAPLDGSAPPERLLQVDKAQLLDTGRRGVVLALPQNPRQTCNPTSGCEFFGAIVAYEWTRAGVVQKVLLSGEPEVIARARRVRSDEDRVALQVVQSRGEALLLYRYGDVAPQHRRLPLLPIRGDGPAGSWIVGDELIELHHFGVDLEVRRRRLDDLGAEDVARVPAPVNWRSGVFGYGLRRNGTLWLHFGDRLALVGAQGAVKGYRLPALGKEEEWAGADLYYPDPEALWIGIEVGRGRDFVQLDFAQIDRRAEPWPERERGCARLPPVSALMSWRIRSESSCGGGVPNPRARPYTRPPVVLELPDGTKIIDGGYRGCERVRFEGCFNK